MSKCQTEACEREAIARGLCSACYRRSRRSGAIQKVLIRNDGQCTIEDCTKEQFSKGLCERHYRAVQRKQNPEKCSVDGCNKPNIANGLCGKHYQRMIKYGDTEIPEKEKELLECSVEGCSEYAYCKTFCVKHYVRFRKHGDVNYVSRSETPDEVKFTKQRNKHNRRVREKEARKSCKRYTKAQVIAKTDGCCGICGKEIDQTLKYPDKMSLSIDHIIPISKGGTNNFDNVQIAHLKCNILKQDRMQEE